MTDLPRLKQGLTLSLFSKGLFYIRAMGWGYFKAMKCHKMGETITMHFWHNFSIKTVLTEHTFLAKIGWDKSQPSHMFRRAGSFSIAHLFCSTGKSAWCNNGFHLLPTTYVWNLSFRITISNFSWMFLYLNIFFQFVFELFYVIH